MFVNTFDRPGGVRAGILHSIERKRRLRYGVRVHGVYLRYVRGRAGRSLQQRRVSSGVAAQKIGGYIFL